MTDSKNFNHYLLTNITAINFFILRGNMAGVRGNRTHNIYFVVICNLKHFLSGLFLLPAIPQ